MSVTASPALITASWAAATNDRPAGNRRNSDVCDKNTRRGGGSLAMTPQHPSTHPTRGHKFAGGRRASSPALNRAVSGDLRGRVADLGEGGLLTVMGLFEFGWCAARAERASVEPADVFQGG